MNITIIGSFRKYYKDICALIDQFEENKITIMSPKKSFIVDNIDGFVILGTDKKNQQPFIIQEHVFENIKKSFCVYVWNPGGYVGKSTCYEIGKIMEMKMPIIFKELPDDLPIKIERSRIKSIEQMITWLKNQEIVD